MTGPIDPGGGPYGEPRGDDPRNEGSPFGPPPASGDPRYEQPYDQPYEQRYDPPYDRPHDQPSDQPFDPRYDHPYEQPYDQPWPPPGPSAPGAAAALTATLARFTTRTAIRPQPRISSAIAGIGGALAVFGLLLWGIGYTVVAGVVNSFSSTGAPSGARHWLVAVLALALVAAGIVLAIRFRGGPLATAGVTLVAFGVPVTMEFLTYDTSSGALGNADAIVWVSILAYLACYLVVPGLRGRTFWIGLVLLYFWEYVVTKVAPGVAGSGLTAGLRASGAFGSDSALVPTQTGDHTGAIAGVSIVFGILYYVGAWWLDRSHRHAMATVLALVAFAPMAVGILALAPSAKQAGTGVVLFVAGLTLAVYGARFGRRFTTWAWSGGAGLGAVLIFTAIFDGSPTSAGWAIVVLGAILVTGGYGISRALREPDDMLGAGPLPDKPTPPRQRGAHV